LQEGKKNRKKKKKGEGFKKHRGNPQPRTIVQEDRKSVLPREPTPSRGGGPSYKKAGKRTTEVRSSNVVAGRNGISIRETEEGETPAGDLIKKGSNVWEKENWGGVQKAMSSVGTPEPSLGEDHRKEGDVLHRLKGWAPVCKVQTWVQIESR